MEDIKCILVEGKKLLLLGTYYEASTNMFMASFKTDTEEISQMALDFRSQIGDYLELRHGQKKLFERLVSVGFSGDSRLGTGGITACTLTFLLSEEKYSELTCG